MPSHGTKLQLLKLLDAAEPDGTKIYPGVASMSRVAQVSERQAQRVMRLFHGVGLLVLVHPGGRGPGDTAEYKLDMPKFDRLCAEGWESAFGPVGAALGGREAKGDAASPLPKGDTEVEKGDISANKGDAQMSPDPSDPVDPFEREGAQAREGRKPIQFLPPDSDPEAKVAFDRIVTAWERGAKGGRGAIGDPEKGLAAVVALSPADRELAAERAGRFLRSQVVAKRSYTPSIETYCAKRIFEHHAPPAAEQPLEQVTLDPFAKPLWELFWRSVMKAMAGNEKARRDVGYLVLRIPLGLTTPAGAIPSEADMVDMVPIEVGSAEYRDWEEYAQRIGLQRLPRPTIAPVIWVPTRQPPTLRLVWKGHHTAVPVMVEARGRAWWWRLFQEGVPSQAIQALLDDRSYGSVELSMGPIPLQGEIDAMIKIDVTHPSFHAWDMWFAMKGCKTLLALQGPIYVPCLNPADLKAVAIDEEEVVDA
jgi:hypothetical protein